MKALVAFDGTISWIKRMRFWTSGPRVLNSRKGFPETATDERPFRRTCAGTIALGPKPFCVRWGFFSVPKTDPSERRSPFRKATSLSRAQFRGIRFRVLKPTLMQLPAKTCMSVSVLVGVFFCTAPAPHFQAPPAPLQAPLPALTDQ